MLLTGETYSEPALTVLGGNSLRVAKPVTVPSPDRSRVVNPDGVDTVEVSLLVLFYRGGKGYQETHPLISNPARSKHII